MANLVTDPVATVIRRGTHRVCTPEDTWRRIRPLLRPAGITRVADLTRLDSIGIPVWQAVRPASLNLSVSQGKGVDSMLARVSAAMEALELWHAEAIGLPVRRESVGAMRRELGDGVASLPRPARHLLSDAAVLDWLPARTLVDGAASALPREMVELDYRVGASWLPPLVTRTSNGLASGNTLVEAQLHGLCELVERDALARAPEQPRRALDPTLVEGDAGPLLDLMRAAGVEVRLADITGPVPVPCVEAAIRSDAFPLWCRGAGCHPDPEVALCRALTEAAQSRLTLIAGARDDLTSHQYADLEDRWSTPAPPPAPAAGGGQARFEPVAADSDLAAELRRVAGLVEALTGLPIAWVDLARREVGLPVVRLVAPGLRVPDGM